MLTSYLSEKLSETAEWRQGKATQYPDDDRNQEAVKLIEKLIDDLSDADVQKYIDTSFPEVEGDESGALGEYIGRIGFHHFPDSAVELLNAVADEVAA